MKTRVSSQINQAIVVLAGLIALLGSFPQRAATQAAAPLRVGMIGLGTSHALRFTELLNDPSHRDHVPGAAEISKARNGAPVTIREVMRQGNK